MLLLKYISNYHRASLVIPLEYDCYKHNADIQCNAVLLLLLHFSTSLLRSYNESFRSISSSPGLDDRDDIDGDDEDDGTA